MECRVRMPLGARLEESSFQRYDERRPMHQRASLVLARLLSPSVIVLQACSAPIAAGLDDSEANRVVVALDHAHVDATKDPDPGAEGKWRVEVSRDDVPRALSVLRDEELPRSQPSGVLDTLGKGSLVPSEAAEHAQLIAGMAGDLQRSLEGVEGVLSARVHLSVPVQNPLHGGGAPHGSASVLLEHRGSTPPLSVDSVQRLVAGSIAGLLTSDVAVVMVSRSAPPVAIAGELGHVGPIAVARNSMRKLQAALVALVAVVALLAGATLALYARLTRFRAELASRQKPGEPSP
jgi:type III secretion protein J